MVEPLLIDAATQLNSRSDLERWAKRSDHRSLRCFSLLLAYLIGAVPSYLGVFAYLILTFSNPVSPATKQAWLQTSYWLAAIPALVVFGPLVLVAWWSVLSKGLSRYNATLHYLHENGRVCEVCEAVALFDDKFVNPSKRNSHTYADLVPRMHVIKKGGEVNVLCDVCLAEVNAMGSE